MKPQKRRHRRLHSVFSLLVARQHFIEIALLHGWSPVNLLHILRTLFPNNTSVRLLLEKASKNSKNNYFLRFRPLDSETNKTDAKLTPKLHPHMKH